MSLLKLIALRKCFLACAILFSAVAFSQKTVSGRVTDPGNQPVVGATVAVKETDVATQTNSTGNFTITLPNGRNVLVVTSIGFNPQEVSVGDATNLSVSLANTSAALSEVVVTALGIQRTKKSLQYSVTTVGGENLTQAREISIANALEGRVAGVNVSKIATGPGGSSRVVIRGAKTLGSNLNQPLYVVDGVPMDNTNQGQAGLWGGA